MAFAGAHDDDATRAITGINITPLVDITLVLLIVFLVTAKALTARAIPVELPKGAPRSETRQEVLAIGIATDGTLTLDGAPVRDASALARAAKERTGAGAPEARAVIAASPAAKHGAVIGAVDALRSVGITNLGFAVHKP